MTPMAELVKKMNTKVIELGDEILYELWINTVPDEADDEDFEDIGNDPELFHEVCVLFAVIMCY